MFNYKRVAAVKLAQMPKGSKKLESVYEAHTEAHAKAVFRNILRSCSSSESYYIMQVADHNEESVYRMLIFSA